MKHLSFRVWIDKKFIMQNSMCGGGGGLWSLGEKMVNKDLGGKSLKGKMKKGDFFSNCLENFTPHFSR